MRSRLEVLLRFRFASGVHVTGERAKLWTDKALVLDWHDGKHPVIPATTLKGWLREGAERALRGLGVRVCDASTVSTICGLCPVCEVFGHPRDRSPLRFHDAKFQGALRDVKMSVSLSRRRKTAYEERLFSTEVAWYPTLEGKVQGIFDSESEARAAAALLWLGANMGYAIGAARSRGLGWVELEDFQASVNGQNISKDDLAHKVRAFVERPDGAAS